MSIRFLNRLSGGGYKLLSKNECKDLRNQSIILPFVQNGFTYQFADMCDYENVKCVVDEVFQYDLSRNNYIKYYHNSDYKILIALKNKEPVGVLCMERQCDYFNNERVILFIRNAGIREMYRRQGVFKQLYAIAYEHAKLIKASALELTCANHRMAAHNFYIHNGFTPKKTTVFIREIE